MSIHGQLVSMSKPVVHFYHRSIRQPKHMQNFLPPLLNKRAAVFITGSRIHHIFKLQTKNMALPDTLKILFVINPASGANVNQNWETIIADYFKSLPHQI